jgi:acyl-CoA synthetase (AMP-forming)/AMP-acid ligase II/acyl carrier protein
MPLFHIHGLIAAVTSSLSVGASVVCTPGFMAAKFFDWLGEHQPTWYTAVPTMHQAIVAGSEGQEQIIADCPLRFVRSSSSSLPPIVAKRLEEMFGVPVIEAYGMTEAAHQMCSNPLPPKARKFGSVGIAAGPEVGVMDTEGQLLEVGQIGEVVIRGANVTAGYEANPKANSEAFTDGWFRTGDEGRIDAEGYLVLTGRLKKIINLGGEKISPREIDEVLLEHPDVAQVVTFAMPDARLGEEVAAAVVLGAAASADEYDLLQFAADKLAEYKIPKRIVLLDAIPKGPTGKLQRIGLAKKLGLDEVVQKQQDKAAYVAPRNDLEAQLAEICSEVLGVERVGVDDNCFDLGGHSLRAVVFISRIRDRFSLDLPLRKLF